MHELGQDLTTGRTVHLSTDAFRRHLYLIGKSGVGKTNLIHNLMVADFGRAAGFCLIDPHGDEAERIADSTPEERFNDVIYLDPADLSHSIAYNPLESVEADQRPLAAEHVLSAFAHVWGLSDLPEVRVVRDPNDDMILASAIAADADYLVTRDRDLLTLIRHEGIAVISPEAFIALLRA